MFERIKDVGDDARRARILADLVTAAQIMHEESFNQASYERAVAATLIGDFPARRAAHYGMTYHEAAQYVCYRALMMEFVVPVWVMIRHMDADVEKWVIDHNTK